MLVLGIGVAGAIGALARAQVDEMIAPPTCTLIINTIGSFILGVLTGFALYHGLGSNTKTVLGTGFCGGFTTFSTFALQTTRLEQPAAVRYIAQSFILPASAAALGLALAAL